MYVLIAWTQSLSIFSNHLRPRNDKLQSSAMSAQSIIKEKPQWGSTVDLYGGQQQQLQAFFVSYLTQADSRPLSLSFPVAALQTCQAHWQPTELSSSCSHRLQPSPLRFPHNFPLTSLLLSLLQCHTLRPLFIPVMYLWPGIRQQLYLLIIHKKRYFILFTAKSPAPSVNTWWLLVELISVWSNEWICVTAGGGGSRNLFIVLSLRGCVLGSLF